MGRETVQLVKQQEVNDQVIKNASSIEHIQDDIKNINLSIETMSDSIKELNTNLAIYRELKSKVVETKEQGSLMKFISDNPIISLVALVILVSSGVIIPVIKLFL